MQIQRVDLVVIDPQNDFCDIQGATLPVNGAAADLDRVADFVETHGERIDTVHVTLDCHHPVDIAHPAWWRDADGNPPPPFTMISVDDVEQGRWRTRDEEEQAASLRYVRALAEKGRYQLVIWPEHCLIGSWGNTVYAPLASALNRWARRYRKQINYVFKGMNPRTEHYSAIQAEVPDESDPTTQVNTAFIDALREADAILIAGEALSHCVAGTVRDIAEQLGPDQVRKLVLLSDCSSAVSGFESFGISFVQNLSACGMQVTASRDIDFERLSRPIDTPTRGAAV